MDFNAIKYIFQIPIEWYKKIHNRVFNAYGSNFLTVREGYYGGTEIGIDSDGFADEVKRVVDLSSVVKSVDNIYPDEDGNVQLCAAVLSATQTFTGDNTFSKPIFLSDYGQLSANPENLRLNLGTNGITLSNSDGANLQLLDNEPPRLYSQGADNQIATRGYCRLNFAKESHDHGNINNDGQITTVFATTPTDYYIAADSSGNLYRKELSNLVATTGLVKSVNDTFPDENGNVAIPIGSGMVNSVDGIGPTSGTGDVELGAIRFINGIPGTNGNFDGVVTSVNSTAPTNGNVDINAVMTVNSTSPDSSGNVDVGTVRAVDGHSPDEQGALSFGLTSGSWVKTDAAGHLTTTNESVISVPADVTPQTVTVTVVADVSWNGTSIVITKNNLNFTNGILTSITDATGNAIATVPYT